MSDTRKAVYRDEIAYHEREIAKARRAIFKAEEWSAAHNDGQRDLAGRRYTETLPTEIAFRERMIRRLQRLARGR